MRSCLLCPRPVEAWYLLCALCYGRNWTLLPVGIASRVLRWHSMRNQLHRVCSRCGWVWFCPPHESPDLWWSAERPKGRCKCTDQALYWVLS